MTPKTSSVTTAVILTLVGALPLTLGCKPGNRSMPSTPLGSEEKIVSLHEFESTEVRHQGFTLPKPMKVHIQATGGGGGAKGFRALERPLFAYGWILNATTREVVWTLQTENSRLDRHGRVADEVLELPAGSYEAYYSNHAFGHSALFFNWTGNIDRRDPKTLAALNDPRNANEGSWNPFRKGGAGLLRDWRHRVAHYGMDITVASAEAASVGRFEAPLLWKNVVIGLTKPGDNNLALQAFHCSKAVTLHVYALGEVSGREMVDTGWILDTKTRTRVWEMTRENSRYAGGGSKNRRAVQTLTLPAGDYQAVFATDDSHSPADWNAAPPCDPSLYGMTLALPQEEERANFKLTEIKESGTTFAQLIRVQNDQNLKVPFELKREQEFRIYTLGEKSDGIWVDFGWIVDQGTGKTVWTAADEKGLQAGGSTKNRMVDRLLKLPKGNYVLHYKSDDSHAYGAWNARIPWDPEHYGITLYKVD